MEASACALVWGKASSYHGDEHKISQKLFLFDANFYSFAMQNFQDAETTSLCWEGLQG